MHFGFTLDLSDIDLLNVDLLDQRYTHLYLFVSKTSWRSFQDMSSRRLQDMFSRRLEDVFSVTIFRLPRRLQDVFRDVFKAFSRRLQEILKTSWKTKNCYAEYVLKTSSRHVLKTSWRPTNVCWGRAFIGRQAESLLISPNIFLHFLIFCLIWMLKSNFEQKTTSKYFWWGHVVIILLLNVTGGYVHLFDNLICLLLWSRIKLHFPLVRPIFNNFQIRI